MKCVILAGGLGSRLSEETAIKPKPMVEIGGMPILWHIMKIYAHHGITDFVLCLGYKGYVIKEYFANYFLHTADVTLDLRTNSMDVHRSVAEPWKISLIDTGRETMTAGRLKKVAPYLENETFCMTYGDGVANVDIEALVAAHKKNDKLATVTTVQPPGRFGKLLLDGDTVTGFSEKADGDGHWINGGFFVLEPGVLDYIDDDTAAIMPWERAPMEKLSADGQLGSFVHEGFWRPMDTLRDKRELENLWESGNAPWKQWAE